MTRNKIHLELEILETQRRLQELQKELLETYPNWDTITSTELEIIISNKNGVFGDWDRCPVGSLLKPNERSHNRPLDDLLLELGYLAGNIGSRNLFGIFVHLRNAAKIRLKELRNEK